MSSKLSIEEAKGKTSAQVEKGGEVVFTDCANCGGTPWDIQPVDPGAKITTTYGGEIDVANSRQGEENDGNSGQNSYSIWTDKFLRRTAVLSVLAGVFVIVVTMCLCIVGVVVSDIFRNTVTAKDLFPLVTAFLHTTVTILMGILLVGFKRRDGG